MYAAKQEPAKLIMGYKPYIKKHSFPQVRCSFLLLAWANGCHYNCSYCWLRAYHPWSWREIHVAEKPVIARVLHRFCSKIGGSKLLNAGELCDSFIAPDYITFMASTLRHYNEEYGRRHRLLLLTKSADPGVVLQGPYQDVVVYSVSVNTETIARELEKGAPSPSRRIHAAMRVKEAGYEVRVRVDPIIAGSEPAYVGLMERVCTFIEPSLVTLGFLRATPRTHRFLPPAVRSQLAEKTPWGYGYPSQTRLSIYRDLITVAKDHDVPVALCKEAPDVWRALKLRSKCNCMP
jgi:DNA repair photolyase